MESLLHDFLKAWCQHYSRSNPNEVVTYFGFQFGLEKVHCILEQNCQSYGFAKRQSYLAFCFQREKEKFFILSDFWDRYSMIYWPSNCFVLFALNGYSKRQDTETWNPHIPHEVSLHIITADTINQYTLDPINWSFIQRNQFVIV
jgi:hypothetical protein